jgi:hypothetical protein
MATLTASFIIFCRRIPYSSSLKKFRGNYENLSRMHLCMHFSFRQLQSVYFESVGGLCPNAGNTEKNNFFKVIKSRAFFICIKGIVSRDGVLTEAILV